MPRVDLAVLNFVGFQEGEPDRAQTWSALDSIGSIHASFFSGFDDLCWQARDAAAGRQILSLGIFDHGPRHDTPTGGVSLNFGDDELTPADMNDYKNKLTAIRRIEQQDTTSLTPEQRASREDSLAGHRGAVESLERRIAPLRELSDLFSQDPPGFYVLHHCNLGRHLDFVRDLAQLVFLRPIVCTSFYNQGFFAGINRLVKQLFGGDIYWVDPSGAVHPVRTTEIDADTAAVIQGQL